MIVRSSWRSDTKMATGRHFTCAAGTSATAKQAIASPSPNTITSDPRSNELPPEFVRNALRTPTAPIGGVTLTFGNTVVVCVTGGALLTFFFGLGRARTFGFGVERGGTDCWRGGSYVGVEYERGVVRRGAGLGAGFAAGFGVVLGGAGSGVGTVGVGTVVGGGSCACPTDGRKSPKASPVAAASTDAPMANVGETRDKLVLLPSKDPTAVPIVDRNQEGSQGP
jgi:hypothetical protein